MPVLAQLVHTRLYQVSFELTAVVLILLRGCMSALVHAGGRVRVRARAVCVHACVRACMRACLLARACLLLSVEVELDSTQKL